MIVFSVLFVVTFVVTLFMFNRIRIATTIMEEATKVKKWLYISFYPYRLTEAVLTMVITEHVRARQPVWVQRDMYLKFELAEKVYFFTELLWFILGSWCNSYNNDISIVVRVNVLISCLLVYINCGIYSNSSQTSV